MLARLIFSTILHLRLALRSTAPLSADGLAPLRCYPRRQYGKVLCGRLAGRTVVMGSNALRMLVLRRLNAIADGHVLLRCSLVLGREVRCGNRGDLQPSIDATKKSIPLGSLPVVVCNEESGTTGMMDRRRGGTLSLGNITESTFMR